MTYFSKLVLINLINKLKNPSIFRGVFYYKVLIHICSILITGEQWDATRGDATNFKNNYFLVDKILVAHITGGQGVASSNLAVPTPLINSTNPSIFRGVFYCRVFVHICSNLINCEWVVHTKWFIQK